MFKTVELKDLGFFRFKRLNDAEYLITNDVGFFSFLNPVQFDDFISGRLKKSLPEKYKELVAKGFSSKGVDTSGLANRYASKNHFLLNSAPNLHIVVVTLRCDHRCVYCQTSSEFELNKDLDMDIPTAKAVVDKIFDSPSKLITIEFQGGEPLLNFDTVKFIVEYALEKNKTEHKNLFFTLVSNFFSMTDKKLHFIIDHKISLCTSLDGPKLLHNKNRKCIATKDSYSSTVKWLKVIQKLFKKGKYPHFPGALTTISKDSLSYAKAIIDEYVALGLGSIHLRPVTPFGFAKDSWGKTGYTADDFIKFYKTAIDYIIALNKKGVNIHERTALIFLRKILTEHDPGYLDIRSPCGAGIGQIAYNFNGSIYSCDEARMLSRMGDDSFKLGDIKTSYNELIDNNTLKSLCVASCLENLPCCSDCVYNPYCGVCPIFNYIEKGNIFGQEPNNFRCKVHMFILDYLFSKLGNLTIRRIFNRWLNALM